MNISCEVIQDLLPLYVENMTSDESKKMIEEHITNCSKCKKKLDSFKTDMPKKNTSTFAKAPLKTIQKSITIRKVKAMIFASLIVFLVMFTVFSYLTKPRYISYENSKIAIADLGDKGIYASFSDDVTSYRAIKYNSSDDKAVMEIVAWTSVWDKLLRKSSPVVLISNSDSKIDTVYYCDYTTRNDNMRLIYGEDPYTNGAAESLPRLILGYYLILAIIGLIIIAVVWSILRKNRKASEICMYLFFIPISYLISHLLITTRLISFSATRDFIMNVIASIAIYGIFVLGVSMFKQHKSDKL